MNKNEIICTTEKMENYKNSEEKSLCEKSSDLEKQTLEKITNFNFYIENEEDMIEKMKILKEKFLKISEDRFIKGMHTGYANAGRTFENLMGLSNNKFEIPDFYGIEIKTKKIFKDNYIHLFSSVPDGEGLFETERLVKKYGYPDKKMRKFPVMYGDVVSNGFCKIGMKYLYKIHVNYNSKKIFLNIYDKNENLLESRISWSFNILKEKLYRKLTAFALVDVAEKTYKNEKYFWYTNIEFYKLKDFKTFIKLIDDGIIKISINIGVYKDEKRFGKIFNHGMTFDIRRSDIRKLYSRILI